MSDIPDGWEATTYARKKDGARDARRARSAAEQATLRWVAVQRLLTGKRRAVA